MALKPHPKHNVLSQWYSNIIFLSKSPFGKMAFCLSLCLCLSVTVSISIVSVCLSVFIYVCFCPISFFGSPCASQNRIKIFQYDFIESSQGHWPDSAAGNQTRCSDLNVACILQGHLFLGQLPPCARQNCVQKRKLWPFFFLFSSCWLIILLIIFSPSFAIPQSTMY